MSDQGEFIFRRPDLARQFADALLGRSPFSYRSGLFLAAPRRTGKSTFLRGDLVPALQEAGVVTIYVDLWSDRHADPASLILQALGDALDTQEPVLRKLLRRAGLARVKVGGLSVEFGKGEGDADATLTEAIAAIAEAADAPVALIVDEAQHALETEAGRAAMFALKAARDALNQTEGAPRLMLVFTGSHRDKLSALVLRREQPFFGAQVVDFPLLGGDFVEAYVAWLNERLAPENRFALDDARQAFELLGSRPELLRQVLRDHALGLPGAGGLRATVADKAAELRGRLWDQYDSDFGQLSDLQRVVMAELIAMSDRFSPFAVYTLERVSGRLGRKVKASEMQAALDALRDKELVWKSGRGSYAIEDQGMAEWLMARQAPPG